MNKKDTDSDPILTEIKRKVVNRIYEQYKDKLEAKDADKRKYLENEYVPGSATEHKFSEAQMEKKKKKCIDRVIRDEKKKGIRRVLENAIKTNFGLIDDTWDWKVYRGLPKDSPEENKAKEIVEKFLTMILSVRYKDDRIIYYDTIGTDRRSYNKYFFRDLKECSLDKDFTNYCEYIESYLGRSPQNNADLEALVIGRRRLHDMIVRQTCYGYIGNVICEAIKMNYTYLVLSGPTSKSVRSLYPFIVVNEEYLFDFFQNIGYREKKLYDIMIRFFEKWNKLLAVSELKGEWLKELEEYYLKWDIFQQYEWRLLCQTTREENVERYNICEKLLNEEGLVQEQIETELDEEKKKKVKELLGWYANHKYAYYPIEIFNERTLGAIYYEIYENKSNMYKKLSATSIANKILRNEYYTGYNLSSEILFLQGLITKACIEGEGGNWTYYFQIKKCLIEMSQKIWDASIQKNYNPTILFELYYRTIVEWMEVFKAGC